MKKSNKIKHIRKELLQTSVTVKQLFSIFIVWLLRNNLPFVVTKNIPITIIQNGSFIFTLNQITQTRKLKTQTFHCAGFTSLKF